VGFGFLGKWVVFVGVKIDNLKLHFKESCIYLHVSSYYYNKIKRSKMKNFILIAITVLISFIGNAQDIKSRVDLRFGIGTSLLGTGDMQTIMFDNEVNMKLNSYFTLGGGLGYGKSDNGVFLQASFVQLNANIYISPFKNSRRNDFRIGTGPSWYSVSDVYQSSARYQNGQLVDAEYEFDKRSSIGFNLIIENTYLIKEKYLLGLKLFTQPYLNGDINSGILLKLGVNI